MRSPIIQQFDIFAQLVATGAISASAKALGINPADVLLAMDELESRIGYGLFQMDGEQVALTPTGQKLVQALGRLSLAEQERWISTMLGEEQPKSLHPMDDDHDDLLLLTEPAPPLNEEADQSSQVEYPAKQPDQPIAARSKSQPPVIRTILPFPAPAAQTSPTSTSVEDEEEGDLPPSFQRPRPATRTITLASHPAIFSHFQEALLAFEQASPDISITLRLEPISAADIRHLFAQGLADIAYFHALEDVKGLDSRYAWSERISLFVGDGHPLTKIQAAMADDLTAFPYIALAPGNPARILAEEALARNGLTTGPAIIETDDLYDIMRQVQEKPCYFAAFGPMARDFGKMRGISRIAYAQGLPQVQVRQAVRGDLAHDPAVLALSEFLFR
ncbi:MAG: LysR family transcriptional regulator [Sphingobium sp.]|nr:LysR family transcriptional regulator [Sphingobium sp.]